MATEQIELGDKARCIVTGFEGIVTSRIEYLNGCVQLCLKPLVDKDGKDRDGIFIDIQQVEYVDKGINVAKKRIGGPRTNAPTAYGLANQ